MVDEHDLGWGAFEQLPGVALWVYGVSPLEDGGFGGLAAEDDRDPVQRGLVAGTVDDVPFGHLGIERLGER